MAQPACPSCGAHVDPLRAGHVAVIGGRFLYFCDRDHKAQYLLAMLDRLPEDVQTAEPPAISGVVATPPPPLGDASAPVTTRSPLSAPEILREGPSSATVPVAFPASEPVAPSPEAASVEAPAPPPSEHVTTGSLAERGGPPSAPVLPSAMNGRTTSDRAPRGTAPPDRNLVLAAAPPALAVVLCVAAWLVDGPEVLPAAEVAIASGALFLLGEAAGKRARLEPKDAATPGAVLRRARRILERLAVGASVATFVVALLTGSSILRALLLGAAALSALSAHMVVLAVAQKKRKTVEAAAAEGIRYRDADAFDRAAQVDRALFCGASTLFTGEPQIVAIEPVGTTGRARLLELAAAAAVVAEHPAARSFVEAAAQEGAAPCELRNVNVRRDEGIVAVCPTGERLVAGGRTFLLKEHVSVAMSDARVSELEAEGRSVLLVALGGKILGLVALQEGLRDGARAAVQALLDVRIEPVLVSHDARATCEALARSLDIDHIRPELVPDDVGREVRDLAEGVHVVAVVGDPARDLAALAAASVPIAVGRSHGTGDWPVSIASRDPRKAAAAVSIPRRYRESAKRSLVIGAAPGALGAIGLFIGALPPVAGPCFALLGAAVSAAFLTRRD